MASSDKMFAVSSLLMIAFFGAAMAKNLHVNWAADVDYAAWAANTTIVEGDRLFFDYHPGPDGTDVVQVSEARFNSCENDPDDLGTLIGDHGVKLSESGTYYFINAYPGKCDGVWKLQFDVLTKEEAAARPPPGPATPTGPFFPVTPTPAAPFFPRTPPPSPDVMPPPHRSAGTLVSLSTLTFPFCLFIFSLFMH